MSDASAPTPFKILCVFGVAILIWILAAGNDAPITETVSELNSGHVDMAEAIDHTAATDLQRSAVTEMPEVLDVVIPIEHQAPKANGVYLNDQGQPIAGAQVELWLNEKIGMGVANALPLSFAAEFITTTNQHGEFTIPIDRLSPRHPQLGLIANGSEYLLLLRHNEYADHREMRKIDFDRIMQVRAKSSANLLSGTVVTSKLQPASKTAIIVDGRLKTWTSARGEFKLNLNSGQYKLVLLHDSGALRKSINIKEDASQQFVISAAESISGQVLDINGRPLNGVQLEAVRESQNEADGLASAQTVTDSSGNFELRGLASGQYHLRSLNPQREYWSQSVQSGSDNVQLQIDDKAFSVNIHNAPAYPVWNNLTVIAEHRGNLRTLKSELGVNKLLGNYQFFLDNTIDATRIIIDLQAAGYKPLRAEFDVNNGRPQQQQSLSLIPEELSAALHLAFNLPEKTQPFDLRFQLREVGHDSLLRAAYHQIHTSDNKRREYYYPHLLAGQYNVKLLIERNSFFNLPEINISGSSIIKIEPDENNFIELDLVAN
ncbi:MAG: carboxypeptidase regulatory-like domain-containing protein [Planctomycetes bacterium]|nr:carboxypeptidase regulatory-like domain-containing protein [Planctomycetota bacterium]